MDDQWWAGGPESAPAPAPASRHRREPPPTVLLDGLRLENPADRPLTRRRRLIVVAIVVVPLLAVAGTVALIPWGSGGPARARTPQVTEPVSQPVAGTGAAQVSPSPTPQPTTSGVAGGPTEISAPQAAELLARAGVDLPGLVQQAWTWTDRDGLNLLAASARSEFTEGSVRVTLEIAHVTDLDTEPQTLRMIRDADLPDDCGDQGAVAPAAGYTPGSVAVTDLDGDGIAEVSIGWTASCGGDSAQTTVKLALLSNGMMFMLSGSGVLGAGGSMDADPDPGSWPPTYLQPLSDLFRRLYY